MAKQLDGDTGGAVVLDKRAMFTLVRMQLFMPSTQRVNRFGH